MAKKKTENIKAAPVLRADIRGDQPAPTPEQTGTRTYQIMDPWKDRGVTNLVDVKAVDGEITDVKVNGQPAGGGGGGDAYIPARVAIDTKGNNIKLNCVEVANYQKENEYFESVVDLNLNTMYVNNIIVPLSANAEQPGANLHLTLTTGLSTAVTGDIEDYGNGDLYVTGDGTITITH